MQGIGLQNLEHEGIDGTGHQQFVHLLSCSHSHHHRFSGGCRAVVHRGVGDIHASQFCHHRLVLEDIVQCALRNLCLIGRVGSQKL